MKAVVFTGKNEVQFTELPDPKPRSGEVVVEVKASGICHTDYEVLKDNYGTGAFPVVPGHEYAGVVVEVGPDVRSVSVGDRVAVDPNLECGTCRACRCGWAHLCENLGAYGVTTHGGFAEFSVVKAFAVHPIEAMTFLQAALAEPMGLLMGLALKAEGIAKVAFVDLAESRLELAASFGFDAVAVGSADLEKWHHRADLAVEATGVPAVASGLTSYMTNGGKGLFFGVCPSSAKIDVSPFEVFRRQLTLAGSHSLNHNIPRSLEVITGLGSEIDRAVSHRLLLQEIAKVLSTTPPKDSLKVQWTTD